MYALALSLPRKKVETVYSTAQRKESLPRIVLDFDMKTIAPKTLALEM